MQSHYDLHILSKGHMMRAESDTQSDLRILQHYKIFLQLTPKTLKIKLFSIQKSSIYHFASFQYKDLSPVFSVVFSDLEEVYKEFKLMNQNQFSFNPQSGQFKYIVKLTIKSLQMCLKLKAVLIQQQQELQIQNFTLTKELEQAQALLAEKDKEIAQYKSKVNQVENLLKKYQMNSIQQLEGFLNEVIKYADFFLSGNKPMPIVSTPVQLSNGRLKRSQKLWENPCKFFKNSEGKHQKLQAKQNQLYSFFPSQESQSFQKFFFGENCTLRLVQNCPVTKDLYLIRAKHSTSPTGRTTIGIKLIKQVSESRGIVIGLKRNDNQQLIEDTINYDSISYNLKTGLLSNSFEDMSISETLMPIKQDQKLHLTVDVQKKTLQCYRNEILIKEFELNENVFAQVMIPFVKMDVAGEEVEFL